MRRARARRHAPISVHALDMSLAPALSKMHIQVPRKALTIDCLARVNDATRDWQRASNLLIVRPALILVMTIFLYLNVC